MKRTAHILAVLAVLCTLAGCSGTKEISYVTDTVIVTDTVKETTHDTVKTNVYIHDSIDREVEKIVYVDSNGVVHERERERLTKYIYSKTEEYQAREALLESRIEKLQKQLEQKQEVVTVEKKVTVWWPLWVAIGLLLVPVIAALVIRQLLKWAEKLEEEEEGRD